MADRKLAETRWFPRYHSVVGEFPGRIYETNETRLAARVIDVSRDGLGILLEAPVAAGTSVELEIDGEARRIPMTVVYCVPDLIHKGRFRAGLHRKPGTTAENLVNIFAAKGCIER